MQVICLEDAALYELVKQVVAQIKSEPDKAKERWLTGAEAMQFLNIKSKTTLQKLRDEGRIRFPQPHRRSIMYDRQSLETYLEQNAHNTF